MTVVRRRLVGYELVEFLVDYQSDCTDGSHHQREICTLRLCHSECDARVMQGYCIDGPHIHKYMG